MLEWTVPVDPPERYRADVIRYAPKMVRAFAFGLALSVANFAMLKLIVPQLVLPKISIYLGILFVFVIFMGFYLVEIEFGSKNVFIE